VKIDHATFQGTGGKPGRGTPFAQYRATGFRPQLTQIKQSLNTGLICGKLRQNAASDSISLRPEYVTLGT